MHVGFRPRPEAAEKKTSPMESKQLATRYAIFIGGLYLLALGIVLIVRSSLGTTPISSENYVLSLHTPSRWDGGPS